jgi:hypothetical protein
VPCQASVRTELLELARLRTIVNEHELMPLGRMANRPGSTLDHTAAKAERPPTAPPSIRPPGRAATLCLTFRGTGRDGAPYRSERAAPSDRGRRRVPGHLGSARCPDRCRPRCGVWLKRPYRVPNPALKGRLPNLTAPRPLSQALKLATSSFPVSIRKLAAGHLLQPNAKEMIN